MKKKGLIISGIIIVLLVIVAGAVNIIFTKDHFIMVECYSNGKMTEKMVTNWNEQFAHSNGSELGIEPLNPILVAKNGEYGYPFSCSYHFSWNRLLPIKNYKVAYSFDFSELSADEQIFFASFTDTLFDETFPEAEGVWKAQTGITLYGCSYQFSEEELENIMKKVKINAFLESEDGTVKKKIINLEHSEIEYEQSRRSLDEYYTFLGITEE